MSSNADLRARDLSRLVQLEHPLLQRLELVVPWCVRVQGCSHPGMYAVHRGAAKVDVFGQRVHLEAGDVVLLPRGGGEHVVGDTIGTTPLQRSELAAREGGQDAHRSHLRGSGPRTLISGIPFGSPPLAWLPRVLVARRRDRDPVGQSLFRAYERALDHGEAEIVARIAEALWLRSITEHLPGMLRFDVAVLRAAATVLEVPAAPHKLRSLVQTASLSRSRFSARFMSAFGEPPMRWVQRVRMEHAERLLQEGSMSVAAVADALGFSDESAFRKAYRRVRGRPARSGTG